MRINRRLIRSLLIASVVSVISFPATGTAPALAAPAPLGLVTTINIPNVPPTTGTWSFDIGWFDVGQQLFFLPDRTNAGIDVIDGRTHALVKIIGGFVGATGVTATSGPNGVATVPSRGEVWASDGDSTVKVADLATGSILATISTGGTLRADELIYDPDDDLIAVGNADDSPPFITFIRGATRQIVAKINLPTASGAEQPAYDPVTRRVYVSIPTTTANPGGEVDAFDPIALRLARVYPLNACGGRGLATGPAGRLLVGCAGVGTGSQLTTQILDTSNGSLTIIPQVGGADQVWYNPGNQTYYVGALTETSTGLVGGPLAPVLGIIDANTNTWIANIPFPLVGSLTRPLSGLGANPLNNELYVSTKATGIRVYAPGALTDGNGFALASAGDRQLRSSWRATGQASSYTLTRMSSSGQTATNLTSTASNRTDTVPDTDAVACYQVTAKDRTGYFIGNSDLLCYRFGVAFGTAPTGISLRFNQTNTATLSWTPAPGSTGTLLLPLMSGSRPQVLGAGVATASDNTGGNITCYVLASFGPAGLTGVSDAICGVPGQATLAT